MTNYFNDPEHVEQYINMTKDYQAGELISHFRNYVEDQKRVLELGMGPGKDLDILRKHFQAVGTDSSSVFVEIYKKNNPDAKAFILDAVGMKELYGKSEKFDAIFSNKVLMHLTKDELATSFNKQLQYLTSGGIMFHSFWYGESDQEFDGLYFQYYTKESIKKLVPDSGEILAFQMFQESEKDDSFYIVIKKK